MHIFFTLSHLEHSSTSWKSVTASLRFSCLQWPFRSVAHSCATADLIGSPSVLETLYSPSSRFEFSGFAQHFISMSTSCGFSPCSVVSDDASMPTSVTESLRVYHSLPRHLGHISGLLAVVPSGYMISVFNVSVLDSLEDFVQ